MRALTGYQAIADREGFVVAFPTGLGNTWNVSTGARSGAAIVAGTADDLTFVER
jgi:poly(3-hydroxybutyrate) depolymerase